VLDPPVFSQAITRAGMRAIRNPTGGRAAESSVRPRSDDERGEVSPPPLADARTSRPQRQLQAPSFVLQSQRRMYKHITHPHTLRALTVQLKRAWSYGDSTAEKLRRRSGVFSVEFHATRLARALQSRCVNDHPTYLNTLT
jgi:hypothetical protein